MKKELLKLKIDGYLKNGDIYQDENFSALISYYISKARHNLLRSEEHTSELQSHSFISYAVFCLKKKNSKYKNIMR